MESQAYFNMIYGKRIIWINQQLKSGKSLEELLGVRVKMYEQSVPHPAAA